MLIIVILCFIIPIIYTLTKKRKLKRYILDKRTIIIDLGISSNIGLILFHLVFFQLLFMWRQIPLKIFQQ